MSNGYVDKVSAVGTVYDIHVPNGTIDRAMLDTDLQEKTDAVDDLKSVIQGALLDDLPIDFTTAPTIVGYIQDNGIYNNSSPASSYMIPVPVNAASLDITASDFRTGTTAYIALLTSSTLQHGSQAPFCNGTSLISLSTSQSQQFTIPSDCTYLCVTKDRATVQGFTPAAASFSVKKNIPYVDATLTHSGDAADAAATGTRIAAVQSAAESAMATMQATIDGIAVSNKNLWTGDASITFTGSKTVTLNPPLPAGTYTLSAVCTSTDTDYSVCRFAIGSLTKDLARDSRASAWFTASSPISSITFYASRNSSASSGDTATWADIQIETGKYASAYEPHRLTALDETARAMVNRITKYVSTSGSDTNDGNTPDSAYATIQKAISATPDIIYIAKGTYNEGSIPENESYRYSGLKIYANGATAVMSANGLQFRYAHVEVSGLTIDLTNASSTSSYGFLLVNCTGAFSDCAVIGAKGAGGFRLDGTNATLERCLCVNCTIDGFNGHRSTDNIESDVTLINCVAHDCGDDGASIHEAGKMYVIGGEYYNNVQTGLAPHNKCVFEALNVHCHHNGIGIEAVEDTLASGETPAVGRVIGCILNDNTTYGLDVKNYTVNALSNGYAGNGTAPTRTQTGGTINTFTVI